MPEITETTEPDLITEVEELLAKATPGPFDVYPIKTLKGDITGFTWGKYLSDQRDADHFWSSELVPFDDAQLYSRSYGLLRRLVEEVKRLLSVGTRPDIVIEALGIMQEKYPGQRIDLSVDPDGYCYVTRSDRNGNTQPIAEGATMGDVFED